MDLFHTIINSLGFSLNIVGALITIWGIFISLLDFLKKEFSVKGDVVKLNETIRIKLGVIWSWPWNFLSPEI